MKEIHHAGTEIFLPVLDADAPLVLWRWTPATRMMAVIETSRFSPQTRPNERPTFYWPLAQTGARMAIGSDRVAATLIAHSQTQPRHPMQSGLGSCNPVSQQSAPQPHDIRLDMIVTEQGLTQG